AKNEELVHHTGRAPQQEHIDKVISAKTATLATEELLRLQEESNVPHGLIYTEKEIAQDEHDAARGTIRRPHVPQHAGNVAMPAPTPQLSHTPGRIESTGPALGEHTVAILTEQLGMSSA